MKMELQRLKMEGGATVGKLTIPDRGFSCFTLEDVVRQDPDPSTPQNEAKVYGETAIPAGTYPVKLTLSPRFKKLLPRILNVPGFDGILIHKGNGPEDTKGCILVGDQVQGGRIVAGASTPAFFRLSDLIKGCADRGEPMTIVIRDIEEAAHA